MLREQSWPLWLAAGAQSQYPVQRYYPWEGRVSFVPWISCHLLFRVWMELLPLSSFPPDRQPWQQPVLMHTWIWLKEFGRKTPTRLLENSQKMNTPLSCQTCAQGSCVSLGSNETAIWQRLASPCFSVCWIIIQGCFVCWVEFWMYTHSPFLECQVLRSSKNVSSSLEKWKDSLKGNRYEEAAVSEGQTRFPTHHLAKARRSTLVILCTHSGQNPIWLLANRVTNVSRANPKSAANGIMSENHGGNIKVQLTRDRKSPGAREQKHKFSTQNWVFFYATLQAWIYRMVVVTLEHT